jgi:hypothetical protein
MEMARRAAGLLILLRGTGNPKIISPGPRLSAANQSWLEQSGLLVRSYVRTSHDITVGEQAVLAPGTARLDSASVRAVVLGSRLNTDLRRMSGSVKDKDNPSRFVMFLFVCTLRWQETAKISGTASREIFFSPCDTGRAC